MDALAALRLQIEWGADEALDDAPHDRFGTALPPRAQPAIASTAQTRAPSPALLHPPLLHPAADHPARVAEKAASAADLATLHRMLDAFQACLLRETASTTVAPSGNPEAGLVLIAEAPGPEDDRAGQAFSGPPGERLDRILCSAGLSRADLLLTFLVPWRPPGGRPPSEAELGQCLPFLHRLLVLVRPRRLVLLGAAPLRALATTDGNLRRARGKWTTVAIPGFEAPIPALPMFAPDSWLSSALNKQTIWADLLLLKEALAPS